jgi:ankyrin repeat protein
LHERGARFDKLSTGWAIKALPFAALRSSANITSLLLQSYVKDQLNAGGSLSVPLHSAILTGNEYMFMLLLDHGADVQTVDPASGYTALHLCIKARYTDTFFIETLVKRGLDVDVEDHDGITAFCLAVANKQFKSASTLLKLGANKEHKDHYVSIEHHCCSHICLGHSRY